MEAIAVGRGVIGFRQTLARSVSSLLSIGSGASIGREGPMVQLAAMLSSLSGRFLVLPPRQLRLLVACGATAGITAAYNAPIAGALFISEIVYGVISSATLVPLVVASVVANIVTRQILHYDAVFHMPPFDFVSGWEVASYLGLGLLAGLLAPQFLRLLDLSRAGFGRLPAPLWTRMALGGLIVGALSLYKPEVWGNGYSVVNSLLHTQWAWSAVAAILLLKIIAGRQRRFGRGRRSVHAYPVRRRGAGFALWHGPAGPAAARRGVHARQLCRGRHGGDAGRHDLCAAHVHPDDFRDDAEL